MRSLMLNAIALVSFVPLVLSSSGCHQTCFQEDCANQAKKAADTPTSTNAQGESGAIQAPMRRLLLERKDLLERAAGDAKKSLENGRGSVSDFTQVRIAALLAGIDLCNTESERIEIHREIVKLYKEIEKQMEWEIEIGQRPAAGLYKMQVARLEAEIDLLKEQLHE